VPTLHNPTATVLPLDRRREIAATAAEHDVTLIEDDVHAYLVPDRPPPLATLSNGEVLFVSGMSKRVAGGLRVGFLRSPAPDDEVHNGMWATTIMAPPPLVDVAVRVIRSGAIDAIEETRRREAERRQRLAREILGDRIAAGVSPLGQFVWLDLARCESPASFVGRAAAAGVRVSPASQFAVEPDAVAPGARVSLIYEGDERRVVDALHRLRAVHDGAPRGGVLGV
jgi:DNA-binding transcriptional MocR family regulator